MNSLHLFIVLSFFFCTMLPRLVADEAELPYLLQNWHGVTPVFSVHSNIRLTCWYKALSTCCHLLWGDCLSAVPKIWNYSQWWRFTTWDVSPSVCSWAFLLGGCENVAGLGGFIFSHGLVLVTSTGRLAHLMLSRWVFLAELTVLGTHCSTHSVVNSCGADSSGRYRVQQSVVSLPI